MEITSPKNIDKSCAQFTSIALLLLILLYQSIVTIKTKKESFTDELTQTYNRSFLRDFFKKINDTYGHEAGEMLYLVKEKGRNRVVLDSDDI